MQAGRSELKSKANTLLMKLE